MGIATSAKFNVHVGIIRSYHKSTSSNYSAKNSMHNLVFKLERKNYIRFNVHLSIHLRVHWMKEGVVYNCSISYV